MQSSCGNRGPVRTGVAKGDKQISSFREQIARHGVSNLSMWKSRSRLAGFSIRKTSVPSVQTMKKDIHPPYRDVVFMDTSTGTKFVTRSTIESKETIEHEGNEVPLVKLEITAASHPFYTGKMKYVDSAGRVEKFQKKYNWGKKKEEKADDAE